MNCLLLLYFKRLKNTRNYEPVVCICDCYVVDAYDWFFAVRAVRPDLSIQKIRITVCKKRQYVLHISFREELKCR